MVKLFEISEPKFVFTSKDMLPKLQGVAKKIDSIQKIILVDDNGTDSLEQLIKQGNERDFPRDVKIDSKEDVCVLPFSSGTTGVAKGVMLTHSYIINSDMIIRNMINLTKNFISLLNLPNFHIYGIIKYFSSFSAGSKIISCRRFTTLHNMLETVQNYKVTDLSSVPPLLLGMANLPDLEKYDLSSVLNIMSGAAPLPESVAQKIKKKTGIDVNQAWGLTEFVPITMAANATVPVTSVGLVVSNTMIKVVDVETMQELGPHEKGEIWAKGPQIMKGYYKRPEATRACIDQDGWFHTGDIGYYDDNDFVYIVDRLKELIKYKGFQVAPAELEEVLLQHPQVADVGVVGVPDEKAGEVPKAYVVRKSLDLRKKDLDEFLKGRVSQFKYLRGGITFCNAIPKSPSGKILRRFLRRIDNGTSKL